MMKFFVLAILIGLTYQLNVDYDEQYNTIYPLRAVAVLHGITYSPVTDQSYHILGSVSFDQYDPLGNVTVTVSISGLPPHNISTGVLRGLHIHTYGILNVTDGIKAACASTGGHYNPLNQTHGSENSTVRHLGDLGNVVTYINGTINVVYNVSNLDLYGPYSIIGRSVVLHEKEDDYGLGGTDMSLSAGSSGARIACGVIGWDRSASSAVENGFLSTYMLSVNLTFNLTQPTEWLTSYLNFDDDSNLPVHEVVDELPFDAPESSDTNDANDVNQSALYQLFSDYIKKFVLDNVNWVGFENVTVRNQTSDDFAATRRRLIKFL